MLAGNGENGDNKGSCFLITIDIATVKQVDNLLYNARKSLRLELEKEGFNYENL